jgi:hypothetical protein
MKGRWATREGGSKCGGQGKENGKKKKRNEERNGLAGTLDPRGVWKIEIIFPISLI